MTYDNRRSAILKTLDECARSGRWQPVIDEARLNNGYAQVLLKEAHKPLPPIIQNRAGQFPVTYWSDQQGRC